MWSYVKTLDLEFFCQFIVVVTSLTMELIWISKMNLCKYVQLGEMHAGLGSKPGVDMGRFKTGLERLKQCFIALSHLT